MKKKGEGQNSAEPSEGRHGERRNRFFRRKTLLGGGEVQHPE